MSQSATLAIDAHVHLHDPASAIDVLRGAGERLVGGHADRIGVTMLAERAGFDVFETLRPRLLGTCEPEALWLDEARRLLVLAGRQIVSGEGLEILGLATMARIEDGAPAAEIVARLDTEDALIVLPWGVGKWLGRRGRIVDELLAAAKPGRLFLGDNGGRPGFWRVPRFAGKRLLSGSDPLPLRGSAATIGRSGTIVRGKIAMDSPSASLKRILRDGGASVVPFGKAAGPLRFFADQARLRLAR
jgi:hypothetical protein